MTLTNSYGESFLYLTEWRSVAENDRIDLGSGKVFVFPEAQFGSRDASNYSGVAFSRGFFSNNDNRIMNLSNNPKYETAKRESRSGAYPKGTILMVSGIDAYFDADRGKSKAEVKAFFEDPSNIQRIKSIDNLATALKADPSLSVTITGSASPIPTNISRQENTTSVENNKKLAAMRAEAGKEFLIDYMKEKIGDENFNPDRINTSSKVTDSNSGDPKTSQSVSFTPKR